MENSRDKRHPLFTATEEGNLDKITEVLKTTDINLKSQYKNDIRRSALHIAIENGHRNIVRYLLETGADIVIKDGSGATPLHTAIEYDHLDIISLLIEKGADINASCNIGWTPLHTAAFCGSGDVVQMLVDQGALISPKNYTGWTPLHTAASNGFEKIVTILINNGATERESAAEMAWKKGNTRIMNILQNKE